MIELKVGDVVTVGRSCMGNPPGARAIVVERYTLADRPGWMLLFQNGTHDGFSPNDCVLFEVTRVDHVLALAGYHFQSVIGLSHHWRSGLFDVVWQTERV